MTVRNHTYHFAEGVSRADTLILFTGRRDAGGRHVNYGIGEPEHVYHCPPDVAWHPTWGDFLADEVAAQKAGVVDD